MEPVRVSIVVPVYNTGNYLKKCVDSILSQTCGDFELILVDDGSVDRSPEICDQYQRADSRVKVIHKPNGGLSSARNAGLEIAVGKYIYFVDSDDYIEPLLLEKAVAVMEEKACDWATFGMVKADPGGSNILQRVSFKPGEFHVASEESRWAFLLKELLNYRIGWEACFHIFRGDIIRKHHLRFVSEREVFAEDLLFSFTYWLYAESCVVVEDQLYHYIQRQGSLLSESRQHNLIPRIDTLAREAYKAVTTAKLPFIQSHFGMVYLHLMEWHTRPYVAEKGIDWIRAQWEKLRRPLFLPQESGEFRKVYQSWVAQFGKLDGYVTVVLPITGDGYYAQAAKYLRQLLYGQTLQKLDVLIIGWEELELPLEDLRIRQILSDTCDAQQILRTAARESRGEYLYFADCQRSIAPDFLEKMCDVMKYNASSTAIAVPGTDAFIDMASLSDRKRFREFLRENRDFVHDAVFRTDLAEASGLMNMENLQEYAADIILSGHIILTHRG